MERLFEHLRYRFFWIMDFLKGGKVKSHYNEIRFIMEHYDSDKSKNLRQRHLKDILDHATTTCYFFKEYKNYEKIEDFPVINKSIIRENFETVQSNYFKGRPTYEMSTSGSSGTPFTTLQDNNKRLRNTADTIYFKEKAGYKIGYRLYYVRKWFQMHKRSWITTYMRNIEMVNVTDFSDKYLDNFISRLEKYKSKQVIISYSSALRDICSYLDKKGSKPIKNNISCIVAMAEGLSGSTRKSLEKYFNTPVLLRYSNLENGIISLQLSKDNHNLQINGASYYVEILHLEKDEPVEEGEMGRIVVTDLFNYAMPFIRYDTGDLGIITSNDKYFNGAPAFRMVQGRKMDAIYNTKGNVNSTFIIFYLESFSQIKQFQFIQDGKTNYRLRLNVEKQFDSAHEIIGLFKSYLGQDAEIKIDYVDGIPQLSSGKRRLTINNYKV